MRNRRGADDGLNAWTPAALDEVEWLADNDDWTGLAGGEFTAAVWILHAMYRRPGASGVTHDDLYQAELASDEREPDLIEKLDTGTVVATGGGLGRSENPGSPWRRYRWAEAAAATGEPLIFDGVPPCGRWLPGLHPGGSWPIEILPPAEGSLDREGWERLVAVLSAASPDGGDTECFAYFCSATVPGLWPPFTTTLPVAARPRTCGRPTGRG